ncbi:MAG: amino acid permease [Myxococcaceae bacterium]|nr:amino acid permease [Myxococcaceae bacterium]
MSDSQAKKLGPWMCTALVVGNMIGSGVFMLPASLAPHGWNSVLGWLFTAGGGLLLAFVFASLARALPQAGGPFAYTRLAFGDGPAFLMAWGYWIALWVGNAAVVTGSVSYVSVLFPVIAEVPGMHALVSCAVIWVLTTINCLGVREAGKVQLVTTVLKLVPLVATIVLAAYILLDEGTVRVAPLRVSELSLGGVTAAATLTLWAMLGLESATVPADKVADPGRTIARATLWGTAVTAGIYLVACSAVVLLMPTESLANSQAPFADLIGASLGPWAAKALALFAAISGFGALNGFILLQGELAHVMAKQGVFPAVFARESRQKTPAISLIVSSALLTVVVMLNYGKGMVATFNFIILLATATNLVPYLTSSLGALRLMQRGQLARSRALMVASVLAALYSLWTLYGSGTEALLWGAVLMAAGWPVYWLVRRQAMAAGQASAPGSAT